MKNMKSKLAAAGLALVMSASAVSSFAGTSDTTSLEYIYGELGLTAEQQLAASDAISDLKQNQTSWGSLISVKRHSDKASTAQMKTMTRSYLNAQEAALQDKLDDVMSDDQAEQLVAFVDINMPAPDYFAYLDSDD
ncbi:hypothetical protein [Reinekea marinisedimentorum]|uniref:LTXXQ motif family protein n=1 Tax=Reinekea marinisedimentorum TaxID=230495 RepID=A0A4R3HWY6_9GAMM|nr:hypothetical protein [Reinekea marinisedimentorum]TCS37672.1 hypothetical protein BCF53_11831 [Reinekea marinisedimentorum]